MKDFLIGLGWLWRIVFGVVFLGVVFYVFDHLDNQLEFIFVSLIGILYLSLRSTATLHSRVQVAFIVMMSKELLHVKQLLGAATKVQSDEVQELESKMTNVLYRRYVTMVFEGVAFLYCVYQLYIHL